MWCVYVSLCLCISVSVSVCVCVSTRDSATGHSGRAIIHNQGCAGPCVVEVVDSGSFDMRGPVGHLWNQSKKDPAVAAQYKGVGKSYSAQRAFRQDWAKSEFDKLVVARTKRTVQSTSFGVFGDVRRQT
jgi:hypothetical protein